MDTVYYFVVVDDRQHSGAISNYKKSELAEYGGLYTEQSICGPHGRVCLKTTSPESPKKGQ